jgi:dipeptidyl aminopeptidase/acylaminoacyl peptidase
VPARDDWGYDPEAQLFANRGYAVLQVNYRGSTGYGKRFLNAAVKQFAGAMHTDLIDGVEWAVKQGIVDRQKMCVYGGSYGGYATLVSVTFTPDVFTCAVDYVGPSSLITLVESFPPYWRPFLEGSWYRFVGDPSKPDDRKDMWARSPLSRVDSIRTPLLIVQGANDPRVTKRESDQFAIALRNRGVAVQYLVAGNEGHGFANSDNRLVLYHTMDQFFARYLGGRSQTPVPSDVESRARTMTVQPDTLKLAAQADQKTSSP